MTIHIYRSPGGQHFRLSRRRVRPPLSVFWFQRNTLMFFNPHLSRFNIAGSLCDGEVASSSSDRKGSNFDYCVWRGVSSNLSQHPQEVLLVPDVSLGPIVARGLESRPGQIFVIGVVHIQCSKLFKGLERTLLPMVLCTINYP